MSFSSFVDIINNKKRADNAQCPEEQQVAPPAEPDTSCHCTLAELLEASPPPLLCGYGEVPAGTLWTTDPANKLGLPPGVLIIEPTPASESTPEGGTKNEEGVK